MKNGFSSILIPDYCSLEVLELYYECYLYNCLSNSFKMEWYRPSEIKNSIIPSEGNWHIMHDQYLKDSENDYRKLGLDIMTNGIYWEIFIAKDDQCSSDTRYKRNLRDGGHRLHSLTLLEEEGIFNRRILCSYNEFEHNHIRDNYTLIIPLFVSNEYMDAYNFFYRNLIFKYGRKKITKDNQFLIINSKKPLYLAQAMFSLLLRNALYEYKQKTGKAIKPHPFFNDESVWEKMYVESIIKTDFFKTDIQKIIF